jgi:hypothetical protein
VNKFLFTFLLIIFPFSLAEASTITLKDCRLDANQKFDKNDYEQYKYEIDTKNKKITNIIILTDKKIQENKEAVKKIMKEDSYNTDDKEILKSAFNRPKISKTEYVINYDDKDYINAKSIESLNFGKLETSVTIYLKEKKILTKGDLIGKQKIINAFDLVYYCK